MTGIAAALHGSARATLDLDVVYRRTTENVDRLVRALSPLHCYLRGAPRGLPFALDTASIQRGLNFTLDTSLGSLDLLGEVVGGGIYEELMPMTEAVELFGHTCRCVTLDGLIRLKRAAGAAERHRDPGGTRNLTAAPIGSALTRTCRRSVIRDVSLHLAPQRLAFRRSLGS